MRKIKSNLFHFVSNRREGSSNLLGLNSMLCFLNVSHLSKCNFNNSRKQRDVCPDLLGKVLAISLNIKLNKVGENTLLQGSTLGILKKLSRYIKLLRVN